MYTILSELGSPGFKFGSFHRERIWVKKLNNKLRGLEIGVKTDWILSKNIRIHILDNIRIRSDANWYRRKRIWIRISRLLVLLFLYFFIFLDPSVLLSPGQSRPNSFPPKCDRSIALQWTKPNPQIYLYFSLYGNFSALSPIMEPLRGG